VREPASFHHWQPSRAVIRCGGRHKVEPGDVPGRSLPVQIEPPLPRAAARTFRCYSSRRTCPTVCSNSRAGNYAPKVFVKRPDHERYKLRDFEVAMEALFDEGEIGEGVKR